MNKPIILLCHPVQQQARIDLEITYPNYRIYTADELTQQSCEEILARTEICFGWNSAFETALLQNKDSHLRWIQSYSAGIDNYNLPLLANRNIQLTTASGIHAVPISEAVIGILLGYYRGLFLSLLHQQRAHWESEVPTEELAGKRMAIIGTGKIGQQLAKYAHALAVNCIGVNHLGTLAPNFQAVYPLSELDNVLATVDIVVNILPLTNETYHFFDEACFKKMKEEMVFINVGRGKSVDSHALIEACQSGIVRFAAIDVVEQEPLPPDDPLWQQENILITPHISGETPFYFERLWAIFLENLASYTMTGQAYRNRANLEKGY